MKRPRFKLGILGNGYVGQATQLLGGDLIECIAYDKEPEKCEPKSTTIDDLKGCDFVFVCVPTPMKKNGVCDLSIVKAAIKDLTRHGIRKKKIILRSTVPVGTSQRLKVHFMPEFLTERNWREDFYNNNLWVFGHDTDVDAGTVEKLNDLICTARDQGSIKNAETTFVSTSTAEFIKYGRNSFLAVKVSVFNELNEFCYKNDIPYSVAVKLIGADERIGMSHTAVPGPDGHRGYGGTCFPKDVCSMLHQLKNSKCNSIVLKAAEKRNTTVDRPEKDWEENKGRAVS
jgi:UDPglucose 6-dehydrogenase